MTEQEKKPVDMGPRMVGSLSVDESRQVRERQASRSNVMGVVLIGLCVLFFAITIVKVGVWG
ncbi:MAG: hypothetical protein RSE16_04110 [Sphingobium sp.]|jgi:hypothetical protein|nr:MAG: hypothetical protein RSE16_04110 [Sphingobium sp.]